MDRFQELWNSAGFQQLLAKKGKSLRASELRVSNWKKFYSLFEVCWIDWLIAGQDKESSCMVGLHGVVYDLTDFLDMHPGSKETILVQGGTDATVFFEDVGHSTAARSFMKELAILSPNLSVHRCMLSDVLNYYLHRKEALEKGGVQSQLPWKEFKRVMEEGTRLLSPRSRTVCREHIGPVRAFYDPLVGRWYTWRNCCTEVGSYDEL